MAAIFTCSPGATPLLQAFLNRNLGEVALPAIGSDAWNAPVLHIYESTIKRHRPVAPNLPAIGNKGARTTSLLLLCARQETVLNSSGQKTAASQKLGSGEPIATGQHPEIRVSLVVHSGNLAGKPPKLVFRLDIKMEKAKKRVKKIGKADTNWEEVGRAIAMAAPQVSHAHGISLTICLEILLFFPRICLCVQL
jgi:hypothetical protein